jgi:hypothetical protein
MKNIVLTAGSIIFGLEVFVIVKLFISLPDGIDALIFWIFVAISITLIHLIILCLFIFSIIKKWNIAASFGLFIVYLLILGAFFVSSVAYNLKTIEKRAYSEDISISIKDTILNTIHNNEIAIEKYNSIIKASTNINIIIKWRGQINDLTGKNSELYNKLSELNAVKESKNLEIDSFALMATRTHISKDLIISYFLASIWLILEIGLWICVVLELNILMGQNIFSAAQPDKIAAQAQDNEPIKYTENWIDFIKEFEKNIYQYIDALFDIDKPRRLNNNINISEKTGLSIWVCNKIRLLLSRGIKKADKFLINITQGKCEANYTAEEMKIVISKIIKNQGLII